MTFCSNNRQFHNPVEIRTASLNTPVCLGNRWKNLESLPLICAQGKKELQRLPLVSRGQVSVLQTFINQYRNPVIC